MLHIIKSITLSDIVNTAIGISLVSSIFFGLKMMFRKVKREVIDVDLSELNLDEFEKHIS